MNCLIDNIFLAEEWPLTARQLSESGEISYNFHVSGPDRSLHGQLVPM